MKSSTGTVQGCLLQVFPIDIELPCYVVEDGSGLHQLHPIDLHHGHLLEQQESIWGRRRQGDAQRVTENHLWGYGKITTSVIHHLGHSSSPS